MKRKIVSIDAEKCNGCGLCAKACHERAIEMVDGKARLVSDEYCDGLGDCLPACPAGAISIIEREAAAYDEAAVLARRSGADCSSGSCQEHLQECPGQSAKVIKKESCPSGCSGQSKPNRSELRQWPIQMALVNPGASYLKEADILIAADCTAYAYADTHKDFMKDRVTIIACPKLDRYDYIGKMSDIFRLNDVKSVTVLRMEVPCCGGLVHMVKQAMLDSRAAVPLQVITVRTDGTILSD